MLIWINGAFGAGKTSVARELHRRLPGSTLFDPEQIGFLLRRLVPAHAMPADFQELVLWRHLVVETARGLTKLNDGPVIVPMTLADPGRFDEVMQALCGAGLAVHHFTLLVAPRTLRLRLWKRWNSPLSKRWTLQQVEPCAARLAAPGFGTHIQTEGLSVAAVTDAILLHLPLGSTGG